MLFPGIYLYCSLRFRFLRVTKTELVFQNQILPRVIRMEIDAGALPNPLLKVLLGDEQINSFLLLDSFCITNDRMVALDLVGFIVLALSSFLEF